MKNATLCTMKQPDSNWFIIDSDNLKNYEDAELEFLIWAKSIKDSQSAPGFSGRFETLQIMGKEMLKWIAKPNEWNRKHNVKMEPEHIEKLKGLIGKTLITLKGFVEEINTTLDTINSQIKTATFRPLDGSVSGGVCILHIQHEKRIYQIPFAKITIKDSPGIAFRVADQKEWQYKTFSQFVTKIDQLVYKRKGFVFYAETKHPLNITQIKPKIIKEICLEFKD
jgi:hypothetical protein